VSNPPDGGNHGDWKIELNMGKNGFPVKSYRLRPQLPQRDKKAKDHANEKRAPRKNFVRILPGAINTASAPPTAKTVAVNLRPAAAPKNNPDITIRSHIFPEGCDLCANKIKNKPVRVKKATWISLNVVPVCETVATPLTPIAVVIALNKNLFLMFLVESSAASHEIANTINMRAP